MDELVIRCSFPHWSSRSPPFHRIFTRRNPSARAAGGRLAHENDENDHEACALLALLALAAGCGGGRGDDDDEASGTTTEASGGGDLSGRIAADSSTVGPYTTAAAERFQNEQSAVQITVGVSGTGGGFERFCRGETDLSNASRPIKDEEAPICEDAGVEHVEFQVANDALTVVVNPANDWATCLDGRAVEQDLGTGLEVEQLEPGRRALPRPGAEARGRHRLRHVRLLHRRDQRGGGASRSDYSATEDDNVTVQGVSGDKGALGYFGFSYFEENQDTLKAVEIDGGDGCVAQRRDRPDGTYKPLSRPLFVYAKRSRSRGRRRGVRPLPDRERDRDRRGVAVRAAHRAARRGVGRVRGRGRG